jgi:hypothetical protein
MSIPLFCYRRRDVLDHEVKGEACRFAAKATTKAVKYVGREEIGRE